MSELLKTPLEDIIVSRKNVFIPETDLCPSKNHGILEISFGRESLRVAKEQAILKAKYTSNLDQSGLDRVYDVKVGKQLEGILGEMGVLAFLYQIDKDLATKINRYDDVRLDEFKSSKNEYDLKIELDKTYFIEARASCSYKTTIEEAIRGFDTIGPYENNFKKNESLSHFYIRPLFQFKTLMDKGSTTKNFSFERELNNNNLKLYLTGGFSLNALEKSSLIKLKSMGQAAKYYTMNIADGSDMNTLEEYFKALFQKYQMSKLVSNQSKRLLINK